LLFEFHVADTRGIVGSYKTDRSWLLLHGTSCGSLFYCVGQGVEFCCYASQNLVPLAMPVLALYDSSDLVIKLLKFVDIVGLVVLVGFSVVKFNGCLKDSLNKLTE